MGSANGATSWRVYAAGEQQTGLSAHMGYMVAYPGIERDPSQTLMGLLGLYGLALVVPVVIVGMVAWRKLGRVVLVLWLLAIVACAGHLGRQPYRVAPTYVDGLRQMEAYSAELEAEAARTGRWPDLARWNAAHQADPIRDVFAYTARHLAATRPEPWAALSVRAENTNTPGRRFIDGFPRMKMDSRAFGPDGLYGTADDDPRLARAFRGMRRPAESWPHGRAPRDPNVKLPPWPKPAVPAAT